MSESLAAVLFDMDGTLVDSEKLWTVGLHELAARYGARLTEAARKAIVGTSTRETIVLVHADVGHTGDIDADAEWLDNRILELFAAGLDWQPGARELLTAVREAGVLTGLVTNTGAALVEVALRTIGRHNFDVVVTGDDVRHAKPHPEPYQRAAASLGVPAASCVAIEDSPAGVASAAAAGCRVLAVPREVPVSHPAAVIRPTLAGIDVAFLRRLVTGDEFGDAPGSVSGSGATAESKPVPGRVV